MKNYIKGFNSGLIAGDEDELLRPRHIRIGSFVGQVIGTLTLIAIIGLASRGIWWPAIWGAAIKGFIELYRQWLLSQPFKSDDEIPICSCGCTKQELYPEDSPEPPAKG